MRGAVVQVNAHIVEIIPDVYQITFRAANAFLILGDELALVDTGYRACAPRIAEFVRTLGRRPEEIRLIILTHNHFDHAGGARDLKMTTGAKMACHAADIINDSGSLPYPQSVQKTLELRPLSSLRSKMGVGPADVDIPLNGGEVLAPLGGLKVIHTPGHTPGSICLLSRQRRLLFAGDTLSNRGQTLRFTRKSVSADPVLQRASIRALAGEDFDGICFGHRLPILHGAKPRLLDLVAKTGD